MKILVIADVHGNLSSLHSLSEQSFFKEADIKICLGDMIVDYSRPNECIEYLTQNFICLLGNNDSYIASGIPARGLNSFKQRKINQITMMSSIVSGDNKEIIKNLAKSYTLEIEGIKFHFCHYFWDQDDDCIVDGGSKCLSGRQALFKGIDADYIIFGHEHEFNHFYDEKKHYVCCATLGLRNPSRCLVIEVEEGNVKVEEKKFLHDFDIENNLECKLVKMNENFFIK